MFCYSRVRDDCPRLLINREKAGEGDRLMALLGMGGGMDFSDKSTRDVAWLGDCDDGCLLLADKLGWGVSVFSRMSIGHFMYSVFLKHLISCLWLFNLQDELKKLVESEHAKIDADKKVEKTETKVSPLQTEENK